MIFEIQSKRSVEVKIKSYPVPPMIPIIDPVEFKKARAKINRWLRRVSK
jgi:hypothetical protein